MKYYGTELNKRRHEILMSAGGIDALEWESERSRGGARPRAWLRTKANSIEGGTCGGDARHRRQAHPRSAGGLRQRLSSSRRPRSSASEGLVPRASMVRDRARRAPDMSGHRRNHSTLLSETGIHQWPSSSPKNNPCCATARAALSATRRRCRICASLRDSKDATGFSRDLWKAFAEMGFSGLLVPENFGGSGLGCVEAGVVMEEIGRTLMPSPFLSTAVLAASALSRGGSEAQKSAHLPKIADGSLLAALAIDEGAKHRPLQTRLQAVRSGNGFKLNGAKAFVVDGHTADLLIVAARTGGAAGERNGLTLFLVDPKAKGVAIERTAMVDAHNAARIEFANVEVDADHVLGEVDQGGALLDGVLNIGRGAVASGNGGPERRGVRPHRHLSEGAQAVRQADRRIPGAAAPRRRSSTSTSRSPAPRC